MSSSSLDTPVTLITPADKWVDLDLPGVWQYRELLYFLAWRDVKIRYKQTALGIAWAVLQPLLTMLVFTIFFGKVAKVPSNGHPYAVFAYAGLLPWTFFANSLTTSSNCLVQHSNLISKVYFPRLIMPAAAVLGGLVDLGVSMCLMAGLYVWYDIHLTWNVLLLPALILLTSVLALALGLFFSALNVKYRDIRYALPFLIQLHMFATPIIYPSSVVPEQWRWAVALNPMAGLVEGFRASLLGGSFDVGSLITAAVMTVVLVVGGAYYFRNTERSFADLV